MSLQNSRVPVLLGAVLFFAASTMVLLKGSFISALAGFLTCASGLQDDSTYLEAFTDSHPHAPTLHIPPGHHGAVASENAICTRIGTDLLKRGGNAADAMVGTTFCTGVIGMYHSGIGGGGFMLIRGADRAYEYIDFRETAPAGSYRDMFVNNKEGSIYGGLSAGVPGEVRGMAYLHRKYGKLPWEEVMQGAIGVARDGWEVTDDLVRYMGYSLQNKTRNFLVDDPDWAVDFAPNGTLVKLGDRITRNRYADTLETIAREGPDVFYTGAMARAMIETVQKSNGTMTMADLANYTIESRQPAELDYRGYKLRSCSAPASGSVALSAFKIIEGYDDIGASSTTNLSTHRLDEALRFAYGQRTSMGDPSFVANMSAYEKHMLSPLTASAIRTRISDSHTLNVSAYNPSGLEILDTPGTSHVVTADDTGLAISMTTTINLLFGAQLIVPSTGVILNDEMNDFSIPGVRNEFGFAPSPANYIEPGKRPFSSITPVIVEHVNGSLYFVVGAAGGSRIITATVLQLWNVLDRNMTAKEALEQRRWHDQLIPNVASFEAGFDKAVVEYMADRGHVVAIPGVAGTSSVQAIRVVDGGFEAASEPRQKDSGGFVVRRP